jgi:hypothetical protein
MVDEKKYFCLRREGKHNAILQLAERKQNIPPIAGKHFVLKYNPCIMKHLSIVALITCLLPLSALNAQNDNPEITKFFRLTINSKYHFQYAKPDSLLTDLRLSAFASNLWSFNMYLYANYSIAATKEDTLTSLLSDTNNLKSVYKSLLQNDSRFRNIFYTSFNKVAIPSISIDSIQKILSRFYYLHRLQNGNIVLHICATINDVLKMKQTEYSPYYNAFCYMIVRDQKPFDILNTDYLLPETDDYTLEATKNKNYETIIEHPQIRQMIINEYESKKQYLNFQVIY